MKPWLLKGCPINREYEIEVFGEYSTYEEAYENELHLSNKNDIEFHDGVEEPYFYWVAVNSDFEGEL